MGGGEVIMEVLWWRLPPGWLAETLGGDSPIPWFTFLPHIVQWRRGGSTSAVCNLVVTSLKTPLRPVWSCGTVLCGVVRLVSDHRRNQMRMSLSAQRESGAAVNCGDLTATSWKKSKTSSQLSVLVTNVSAVACLFFTVFFFLSSYYSLYLSLLSFSLSFSSPPSSPPSSALSMTEQAKILRGYPVSVPPSRIDAFVRNYKRKTALRRIQYRWFFYLVRSLAAAQRSISMMGRRILLPSVAKAIVMLIEITKFESSDPARANATTDSPRDLFPTDACLNVSWISPGVLILVSMPILGKSSQTFYIFRRPARSCAWALKSNRYSCYRVCSDDDGV